MGVRVRVSSDAKVISKVLAVIIVLIVIVGIFLAFAFDQVGVGEVAIIIDPVSGGIVNVVTGPRYFFKMPWQVVDKVYIAVDTLDMWTDTKTGEQGEWPSVPCLTKDGLQVYVDITVRWRIDPNKIIELYRNYPSKNWESRALAPLLRETLRNIISNYTATETIEKRSEIASLINSEYIKVIQSERTLGGAIIIEGIDLRNIDLPANFKAAVEEKLTQQQLMMAAEYSKKRTLILANASAEAEILKAWGEAKAKLILTNATSASIQMIKEVVGDDEEAIRIYIMLLLLKDVAQTGKNVYILVGGGERYLLTLPGTGG
ncbi:MAG TPA: prohibitin family protein [Thermoprotei archaeon]|nr:prohibitin family protein [Thermoprotei archaeon]